MKNIAIIVSGNGEATLRVISLFSEGNRVKTQLVIAIDEPESFTERVNSYGIDVVSMSKESFSADMEAIIKLIESRPIDLVVTEGLELPSDNPLEETLGQKVPCGVIKVVNADDAPLRVVKALEFPSYSQVDKKEKTETPPVPLPKTPDEQWAESLQINFERKNDENLPPVPDKGEGLTGSELPPIPTSENEPIQPEQPKQSYPRFQENPYHSHHPQNRPGSEYNGRQYNNGQYHNGEFRGGDYPGGEYRGADYRGEEHHRSHRHEENQPMPSTYLIWAILTTIFCCFIPGIVAIVFSSQVSSRYYAGDIEGAKKSSRNAEIWIIVSIVLGVLTATLYLPFLIIS